MYIAVFAMGSRLKLLSDGGRNAAAFFAHSRGRKMTVTYVAELAQREASGWPLAVFPF